jgi:hypothetical protein
VGVCGCVAVDDVHPQLNQRNFATEAQNKIKSETCIQKHLGSQLLRLILCNQQKPNGAAFERRVRSKHENIQAKGRVKGANCKRISRPNDNEKRKTREGGNGRKNK